MVSIRRLTQALLLPLAAVSLAGSAAAAEKTAPAKVKLDAAALAGRIDQAVQAQLDAGKIKPSPLADDAEFVRRVYLDITGVIPTANQAAAFLDSQATDKRAKLIDQLLADPRYGRHLADIWEGLLVPRNSDNRRFSADPLTKWLEEGFNKNKSWDKLVSDLLTATGSQDENGAITFFVVNPTPDKMTDQVCKLFLGVQLQCAQCHNHPFTSWKQTEYWAMAQFFMKVRSDRNAKQAAKQGVSPTIVEGEGKRGKGAQLPESAKMVPAKFLQGVQPKLDPKQPYRPVLAKWMTAPENPYFARAMVNRMWAEFFGRGFVNPIDNMHDGNPPSHPELLQDLSAQFTANGFDLKYLVRAICNSQTYQRSSKPYAGNEKDSVLYSHMAFKVLSPEQLFDSLSEVAGAPERGKANGRKAQGKNNPGGPRTQFVTFFQLEEGADPTEYQAGIPQALRLMNSGEFFNRANQFLTQTMKAAGSSAQICERLYLASLSRRPTAEESQKLIAYVQKNGGDKKAYSDVLWALLNTSEFTLNH